MATFVASLAITRPRVAITVVSHPPLRCSTVRMLDSPLHRPNVHSQHPRNSKISRVSRKCVKLFKAPLTLLFLSLLGAATFMTLVEHWNPLDAFYFAVAVATTVGYGDLAPQSSIARAFVAIYAIFCATRVGALLATAVDGAARAVLIRGRRQEIEAEAFSRVRAAFLLLLIAVIAGLCVYAHTLSLSPLDAIYFVAVSVSTVGLGDVHPQTPTGRAFAAAWLVFGAIGFANLLARFAEWRASVARTRSLAQLARAPFSPTTFHRMDTDGDGRLSQAEFLGYAVCKLGALSDDEVRAILDSFHRIDKNGSGTITSEEVKKEDSKNIL